MITRSLRELTDHLVIGIILWHEKKWGEPG
jgi:hypothetical protein